MRDSVMEIGESCPVTEIGTRHPSHPLYRQGAYYQYGYNLFFLLGRNCNLEHLYGSRVKHLAVATDITLSQITPNPR